MLNRCMLPLPLSFALVSNLALAELTPVGDHELSSVTGSNGITMELSSVVSLKLMEFEDSGSIQTNDVVFGGGGVTASGAAEGLGQRFDDLALTFDVESDGSLQIGINALASGLTGAVDSIDWGVSTGAVDLVPQGGTTTRFVDSVQARGKLLSADYTVSAELDASGYGKRYSHLMFTVDDLDVGVSSQGLSVQDGYVTGTETGGLQIGSAELQDYFARETSLSADQINESVSGAENGFAVMNSSIGTEEVIVDGVPQELRTIRVNAFAADVGFGSLSVGGANLGAAQLDNLRVSDTVIRFHPQ